MGQAGRSARSSKRAESAARRPPAAPAAQPRALTAPIGNQANLRRLQAKLTIGAVNDPLEREADAAADLVMRMAGPEGLSAAPPALRRKCAECEDEEKLGLQRKADSPSMANGAAPVIVDTVLSSPGRSLDPVTRDFMGERFGADFSGVRIHTDAQAAQSAEEIDALAYTVGHHIVFGASRFSPNTATGLRLLAHELTHVLQQTESGGAGVRQSGDDITIRRDVPQKSKGSTGGREPRESFPWIGRIRGAASAALRRTPGKNPDDPHSGIVADLPEGKFVDVLGNERGWLHVQATVEGKEVQGYVSQELVEFNRPDAPPPGPTGPPIRDIMRLDQRVPIKGLVENQPNYIDHFIGRLESAPIGDFYFFFPKTGPASQTGISIPKGSFHIDSDPLAGFAAGPNAVYKSRDTAEAVVAALTQQTPDTPFFTFYLQDGIIFPTTLSDTTIPNMMVEIRKKREQDREDLRATAALAQAVANSINPVPCTEVEADGSLTVSPSFGNCVLPIALHAAPRVMGGNRGTPARPGEAPKSPDRSPGDRASGEATGTKPSEIAEAVARHEINAKQLAAEVGELRRDAGDPAKVHRPTDPNSPHDAEMVASDGHEFHRDKKTQLWERCSPPPCKKGLKLDAETNKKVDAAVQAKDKPVAPDDAHAPPAARQTGAPLKWAAGQIQGVDQVRIGQTIAVAEIRHPNGTIEKVAACYEKAGWRPEQAERALELGYRPLPASTPGSGMHAEQELAAYAARIGGRVVHGHWAISRGRGGNSIVCPICEDLTRTWGPPQGGKD